MYVTEVRLANQGGYGPVHEGIINADDAEQKVANMEFAVKLWKNPPAFRFREMTPEEVKAWEKSKEKH